MVASAGGAGLAGVAATSLVGHSRSRFAGQIVGTPVLPVLGTGREADTCQEHGNDEDAARRADSRDQVFHLNLLEKEKKREVGTRNSNSAPSRKIEAFYTKNDVILEC